MNFDYKNFRLNDLDLNSVPYPTGSNSCDKVYTFDGERILMFETGPLAFNATHEVKLTPNEPVSDLSVKWLNVMFGPLRKIEDTITGGRGYYDKKGSNNKLLSTVYSKPGKIYSLAHNSQEGLNMRLREMDKRDGKIYYLTDFASHSPLSFLDVYNKVADSVKAPYGHKVSAHFD